MSLIAIPDDVPAEALARVLADCGLVLDPLRYPDGINRYRWACESGVAAVRAFLASCQRTDCDRPATIHFAGGQYCADHYMEAAREMGAV